MVVRYKSTGDILAGNDRCRKRREPQQGAPTSQQPLPHASSVIVPSFLDEEQEAKSKTRHGNDVHEQQIGDRKSAWRQRDASKSYKHLPADENDNNDDRCRWQSCKFLGQPGAAQQRRYCPDGQPQDLHLTVAHSKSTGDFGSRRANDTKSNHMSSSLWQTTESTDHRNQLEKQQASKRKRARQSLGNRRAVRKAELSLKSAGGSGDLSPASPPSSSSLASNSTDAAAADRMLSSSSPSLTYHESRRRFDSGQQDDQVYEHQQRTYNNGNSKLEFPKTNEATCDEPGANASQQKISVAAYEKYPSGGKLPLDGQPHQQHLVKQASRSSSRTRQGCDNKAQLQPANSQLQQLAAMSCATISSLAPMIIAGKLDSGQQQERHTFPAGSPVAIVAASNAVNSKRAAGDLAGEPYEQKHFDNNNGSLSTDDDGDSDSWLSAVSSIPQQQQQQQMATAIQTRTATGEMGNGAQQSLAESQSSSGQQQALHQIRGPNENMGQPKTLRGTNIQGQHSPQSKPEAGNYRHQQPNTSSTVKNTTGRVTRTIARPGRSPVSLQRSTDARLTRHRLKIQQQRQEQLAKLALRERLQLNGGSQLARAASIRQADLSHSSRPSQAANRQAASISTTTTSLNNRFSQNPNASQAAHQDVEITIDQPTSTVRPGGPVESTLTLFTHIIKKLRLPAWARTGSAGVLATDLQRDSYRQSRGRRRDSQESYSLTFDGVQGVDDRRQQVRIPGDITPQAHDNQVACGSNDRLPFGHRRDVPFSANGNVIVYRSIDMQRNMSSYDNNDAAHSSPRDHHSHYDEAIALHRDDEDIDDNSLDTGTICSSVSSINLNKPFCKICHMSSNKNGDRLISPCKCSGTMRYVHCGCLLKWLKISNRAQEKPMSCELCSYEYAWQKKFDFQRVKIPKCSVMDKFLHLVFIATIGLMLFCALAPILRKKPLDTNDHNSFLNKNADHQQLNSAAILVNHNNKFADTSPKNTRGSSTSTDNNRSPSSSTSGSQRHSFANNRAADYSEYSNHLANSRLAQEEKFMLFCAATFFMSFFVAIYVESKARYTLYGLFVKFLHINQTYYITEYDHGQSTDSGGGCNVDEKHQENNLSDCTSIQQQQRQQSPRSHQHPRQLESHLVHVKT